MGKKYKRKRIIRRIRTDDGWLKYPTPGSTVFGNSWYDMRNSMIPIWPYYTWQLPSSLSEKQALFTDRLLTMNDIDKRIKRLKYEVDPVLSFSQPIDQLEIRKW